MKIEEKPLKYWLKQGKQSKLTPKIKTILNKFQGNEFEKISQILKWIEGNIKSEKDYKKVIETFASRNAEQIIKQKNNTGCHDTALILVTFLRGLGIPAKYVVGISKTKPSNRGHCVAEANINKNWIIIDPGKFQLNLIPLRSSFYEEYYIVKKGLDSWDCGIKYFKDWKKISTSLIKQLNKVKT